MDLEPFTPPDRYNISQSNSIRNSNYYPIQSSQYPQTITSQALQPNVYNQQQLEANKMIHLNESIRINNSIPVQQVIRSSEIPEYIQVN